MDAQQNSSPDRLLQDDIIDLRQYWLTVMRHKWHLWFCTGSNHPDNVGCFFSGVDLSRDSNLAD